MSDVGRQRLPSAASAWTSNEAKPTQQAIKVSMVQSCRHTETADVTLHDILTAIRNGRWKKPIEAIRSCVAAADAEKAEKLKNALPAITPSGKFRERKNEALIQHSGMIVADLDKLGDKLAEIRRKIERLSQVLAVFLSPSGTGLKVFVRVPCDPKLHLRSFRAVEKLILDETGIQIDKTSDLARLCFVSFDPNLYYNERAIELEPLAEKPEKPQQPLSSNSNLSARERIAQDLLGQLRWSAEKGGYFCDCPGEPHHRNPSAEKHTIVYLAAVPTLDCRHTSCKKIVEAYNTLLRSRIGKAEYKAEVLHNLSDNQTEIAPRNDDDAAIARLAGLPLLDYERARKDEAEKLGIRAPMLDKLVSATRERDASGLQGAVVTLADIEPWPEAVSGAHVLAAIAETFSRYVVMSDSAADVSTLYCAHTHCFPAFQCSPRLNITSPEKQCGKTTLRDVVALFVPRPVLTENMTTAVLFRLVDAQQPVVLADETDAWITHNEELRGLLNAGHRKGAMVYRCEGDNNEVRGFAAFAPAVLCGIGSLPATLHDRSIVIRLERAKRGELQARFDSRHVEREHELCRKLARWCTDNRAAIAARDPELPADAFNRVADNWRPLFAIAEVAGGDWPQRCTKAFTELTSNDADADGLRVMLLADIQQVFTGGRIFSKDLIEQLAQLSERPWPEVNRGKPITERWLARNLATFRIHSKTLRIGDERAKGYERTDFEDAFSRYLGDTPLFKRDTVTIAMKNDQISSVTKVEVVTDTKNASLLGPKGICHGVTDKKGGSPPEERIL